MSGWRMATWPIHDGAYRVCRYAEVFLPDFIYMHLDTSSVFCSETFSLATVDARTSLIHKIILKNKIQS